MNTELNIENLRNYDLILLNTSGGKDSQVMISKVMRLARFYGVTDRVVAVHADLGRVEWQGTKELAERQASLYGVPRFETVSRPQGDLIDQIRDRGMFPSSTARFCTSDQKRGQVAKVVTMLHREWKAAGNASVFRVLNCFGFRADESPARAKRAVRSTNKKLTTQSRTVTDWLPIHTWSTEKVWDVIRRDGVPYHAAYDKGMSRLSCVFCIFAPRNQLMIAAQANPELFAQYVELERDIDHTFRKNQSLAEVAAALDAGEQPTVDPQNESAWNM